MRLRINDRVPAFRAHTTHGMIDFHDWIEGCWCLLFSHPKDFTPVCTTELGAVAGVIAEFERRNCKVIGLSVDPVASHAQWKKDIESATGHAVDYPLISDFDMRIAKLFGMLPRGLAGSGDTRSADDLQTVRTVFIIGPDKRIKTMMAYPMSVGRNFEELLRILDALQLTAAHRVTTPANWRPGDDVIIAPSVPDEEATQLYGTFEVRLPYLRMVPQPDRAKKPKRG